MITLSEAKQYQADIDEQARIFNALVKHACEQGLTVELEMCSIHATRHCQIPRLTVKTTVSLEELET